MGFKDCIADDLRVFLNTDEFAELHTIDGVQLSVVVDDETLKGFTARKSNSEYGYQGGKLIYVKKADFGDAPAVEQIMNFDGDIYRVTDVGEDSGMYSITLAANMS